MTVQDLMKLFIKHGGKKFAGFDIRRVRLTLNEAKGRALSNRKQSVVEALKDGPENLDLSKPIKLIFKDMGLQISW